jgi:hypothetical protein
LSEQIARKSCDSLAIRHESECFARHGDFSLASVGALIRACEGLCLAQRFETGACLVKFQFWWRNARELASLMAIRQENECFVRHGDFSRSSARRLRTSACAAGGATM